MAEKSEILYKESNENFKKRKKKDRYLLIFGLILVYFFLIPSIPMFYDDPSPINGLGIIGYSFITFLIHCMVLVDLKQKKKYSKLIISNKGFRNPIEKSIFVPLKKIDKIEIYYYNFDYLIRFYYKNWEFEPIHFVPVIKKEASKIYYLFKKLDIKIEF